MHTVVIIRILHTTVKPVLNDKVSKGAKIRSRYNQVPHPTQDTNGKVTNSQLDTTNESQEVSPFPAGDHKAHINGHAQRHSTLKEDQKLFFKTDHRLMQVESIAECSNGSILQYFRPSLSYHLPLRPLFCLF